MSLVLGSRGERLPLDRAVDHLIAAARWAGTPGLPWIAGIAYPSVQVSWSVLRAAMGLVQPAGDAGAHSSPEFGALLQFFLPVQAGQMVVVGTQVALPLLPLLYLCALASAGLAVVSQSALAPAGAGPATPPRLRAILRAGRGLALPTLGMWVLPSALLVLVLLVLAGPIVAAARLLHFETITPVVDLLLSPVLLLLLAYGLLLQVLQQLALHSLVRNRRGVASALTHAWRLMRAAPWSTLRATLVDALLLLFVFLVERAALALGLGTYSHSLPIVLGLAAVGFCGVARAAYWGEVYRALGGLSPGDRVPGLAAAGEAGTAR